MSQLVDKTKNFIAEKVANVKKPEANITDVDFKKVSRDSATFNAQVSVTNPYGHAIPICEISYTLKSANRVIASGTIPDPGSLTANETTKVDVPVKVPYSILVSLARDIGSDWDIDYVLELGFTVDLPIVGNFTLPLPRKGEVKLPTLADVF
ncbi:PREDICTED: late embryogenesis abundant protein Lea14-A [Nelumbo nucifera]|uniref:Late embryogenesis abundant protein Lea14-A n=2 Tax=Nelumbo nucifera TaxID=4432 RepID=A0A1U8AH73_NELNU|nr:PREDICTED: late embryogenesis abundant protein Lea14-A [Nelumbo nucifera]DAD19055.1 TPA_asm: hypothetical protein HUJ06_020518 [Nelumbo nucifera]